MQEMLEAIGNRLTGTVHYGQMPDEPDNITLLNFSSGNSPRRALGKSKPVIREPEIQVRVRDKSYFNCISLIDNHITILESLSGTFGNLFITKITQVGDVIPLGRDNKNRYDFSINFIVQIDNKEV